MPYIKQYDRHDVSPYFTGRTPENAGELNFVITQIIADYFSEQGGRYQQINDILGALEGAKMEFYRRVAVPYETEKCLANGDVYD